MRGLISDAVTVGAPMVALHCLQAARVASNDCAFRARYAKFNSLFLYGLSRIRISKCNINYLYCNRLVLNIQSDSGLNLMLLWKIRAPWIANGHATISLHGRPQRSAARNLRDQCAIINTSQSWNNCVHFLLISIWIALIIYRHSCRIRASRPMSVPNIIVHACDIISDNITCMHGRTMQC